ncbi:hypothetical protein MBGDF03_00598 [Thermoplasmatales archaeon SCGC AB-540-F20]|nr:hypothetical protein MBGDF03_00598 [Thermoplasmatales archaeon SCGC AB-540-F20]
MNKKILVSSIIAISIMVLVSFPTTVGTIRENEQLDENEPILGWHTYRFCFISGVFYDDSMFPNIIWVGPFPIVSCRGYLDAKLFGLKGEVEPKELIGFGFRGFIYPYIPRSRGNIEGYFRICLYKT